MFALFAVGGLGAGLEGINLSLESLFDGDEGNFGLFRFKLFVKDGIDTEDAVVEVAMDLYDSILGNLGVDEFDEVDTLIFVVEVLPPGLNVFIILSFG